MRRILEALKAMLMKDLNWKILSLFIAVALWLVVINIENPIESRSFRVTLTEENIDSLEAKGLVAINSEEYLDLPVNVKVRGQRLSLDQLYQRRGEIKAYVDFKKAVLGENYLLVDVSLPSISGSSFQTEGISPKSVSVLIDGISSKTLDIDIVMSGDVKRGYITSQPVLSVQTAEVSGPAYLMERVDSIKAVADITGLEADFSGRLEVLAYDASGGIVEGVTVKERYVNVNIPINLSKTVPLKLTATGVPLDGYTVTDIAWTPQSLKLMGDSEVLREISEIVLPVVNIEGASSNISESFAVTEILPEGIWVLDNAYSSVNVLIKIERIIEREIEYSGENIRMTGSLKEGVTTEFAAQDGVVVLRGADYLVSGINESSLAGSFDISGFDEGGHDVEIVFDLPEGVEIVGENPVIRVNIKPLNG